jgi:uncharacterized protein (DUF1501 family)
MKRRDFLKTGLKAGVALNALPLMVGNSPVRALGRSPLRGMLETLDASNNNVLVIVQLAGGNDGLNTIVPIANADDGKKIFDTYKTLRPSLGLYKSNGDKLIDFSTTKTFAWHPSLQGLSDLYEGGELKIIRNVGYANPNLSHFRGTDIWNTATDSNLYASTGWIGRYFDNANLKLSTDLNDWPLAIQFGSNLSNAFLAQNGGMGIAIGKMPDPQKPSTHNYDPIPTAHTTQYDELAYIRLIQLETETYTQTILNRKVVASKQTYPKSQIATDLSNVAQLISSQFSVGKVQTKIYLVTHSGYDTHSNQLSGQAKLLSELSAALKTFQIDLKEMGIADNVATMTYSEFGRRPQENGSGTDHGTAAPHFVISTKLQDPMTFLGKDPDLTAGALVAGNLQYQYDFRTIYASMLNEWLLAGGTDNATLIDKVLKTDDNGVYSTSSGIDLQPLGIFQPPPQQRVAASDGPGLMLMQNYPNPASNITTFEYALPATGPVMLSIYDSRGVEIERVVDARQEFGVQRAEFDVSRLPAGPYLYRLRTTAGEVAQQMMVVH